MATALLATVARAQQTKKASRIGFFSYGSVEIEQSSLAAFRQKLRELGYLEGQNIVIEQRYAIGRSEKLPELLAELMALKVDLLVVAGDPAVHAAKKATNTIPIVMVASPDPVGTGLIASLAHPGGNVTGLSDFHGGVITKRLELLKEVVPSASRFAVLLNPVNPSNPLQLKDIQAAAPAFRVTLLPLEIKGPDDMDHTFTTIEKERPGALLVIGDRLFATHQKRIFEFVMAKAEPGALIVQPLFISNLGQGQKIAQLALKHRLATISDGIPFADQGGLLFYGPDQKPMFQRAAIYVDKILKGIKPGDLPIEQPTKFELVINLKTAKQIGVMIPAIVLARADRVIR